MTQRSQFRPFDQPTASQSQLHFTPGNQNLANLTSTRPNAAQPLTESPSFEVLRPQSPHELTQRARKSVGDAARPFEAWLRRAMDAERAAYRYQEQGDFESAFFEFGIAGIILIEKIPCHPDFIVLLTTTQRHSIYMVSYLRSLPPTFTCPRTTYRYI